jgi:lipopolysaccharide biosynthesis regulator YciM
MLAASVAEKVAGRIPCSMITVKSEHAIRLRLDAGVADIRAQCIQGQELLKKGFPAEAVCQFEQCIAQDGTYIPAWEGLAAAYRRLGQEKNAERCLATAREMVQTHGERLVYADLRSKLIRLLRRSR